MKPWRIGLVGVVGVGLIAGLVAGPELLQLALFWLFFLAVPGPLALRFLNIHNGFAYVAAGAVCGVLGLVGADFPEPSTLDDALGAAVIGAMFGVGWKLLLCLCDELRSEACRSVAPLPSRLADLPSKAAAMRG
jgi:hypothetical protein